MLIFASLQAAEQGDVGLPKGEMVHIAGVHPGDLNIKISIVPIIMTSALVM